MKAGNGILKGELKVKGGKLVKCSLSVKDGVIEQIKFTGDFFMYPEEEIEELEKMLEGVRVEEITEIFDEFFPKVRIFGASKQDFFDVISIAIKNLKGDN